jgi:hypothetical protein
MSSIRRSSLISITWGPLTVIGANLSFATPRRRQDNASNAHLSQAAHSLIFWTRCDYRGFKVAHRTDNHSRWASRLVAAVCAGAFFWTTTAERRHLPK